MSVLKFTATVKKREVVVSGVDLPDGAQVDVTIDPSVPDDIEFEWTAEMEADFKQSAREYRRGEYYRGEDYTRWLRGGPRPVLVRDQPGWRSPADLRREKLATAARDTKPTARRGPKRPRATGTSATARKRATKR
jgi:hypothetical protein